MSLAIKPAEIEVQLF